MRNNLPLWRHVNMKSSIKKPNKLLVCGNSAISTIKFKKHIKVKHTHKFHCLEQGAGIKLHMKKEGKQGTE